MTEAGQNALPPVIKDWAELWLSPCRFSPYLAACKGDYDQALDLYEWNISLGHVLMRDISHFEIALRNAYNRVISECWRGDTHWLFDNDSPVRRPILRKSGMGKPRDVNLVNRKAIDAAAGISQTTTDSNKVISSLTLGFWTHMTDRSRERDLWIPILHNAWPKGYDRAELQKKLLAINTLRNRVAHNERLFNPRDKELSPLAVGSDLVTLFGALCPQAAAQLCGTTAPVNRFLAANPPPAKIVL